MCLDRLSKRKPVTKGYKLFRWRDGRLYTIIAGDQSKYLPLNQWVDEVDYRNRFDHYDDKGLPCDMSASYYPTGFHVYDTLKGALDANASYRLAVIYEVEMQDIVAQGTQDGKKVTVCKKLRLLREVE